MTPGLPQPDTELQRAESAKKLKSAWTSMIVSSIISLLLLVWIAVGVFSGRYAHMASGGQGTVVAIVAAVIVIRVGFNAYRLYNKWKTLKAAQDHHRTFN